LAQNVLLRRSIAVVIGLEITHCLKRKDKRKAKIKLRNYLSFVFFCLGTFSDLQRKMYFFSSFLFRQFWACRFK
jgi:hypothetical protein